MNYEEIIEKIEDILEEGKPSFGGGGKIKVDGDAIIECLKELSASIPKEIIQARKIVAERRDILQSAQETASAIVNDANIKAQELVEEHEITKTAKEAAIKMLNEAKEESKNIIDEAEEKAVVRETHAKKWSAEMRKHAKNFAEEILSQCSDFLIKDIEHYQDSLGNVELALKRLEDVVVKDPEDDETEE